MPRRPEALRYRSDCRLFTGYRPCSQGGDCAGCERFEPYGPDVLLINLDAMGDVLRSTAQLPALRRAHSQARISWLTRPRAAPLLQGHPELDRVLVLDADTLCELDARSFDLLLNVDKSRTAGGLAMRIQARDKRGFGIEPNGAIVPLNPEAAYLYRTGLDDELKFRQNRLSEPQMLGEALALPYQRDPYVLHLAENERRGAPALVGFNTGSSETYPFKRLPLDVQEAAIRLVVQRTEQPVLLLGGPEDEARNRELARRLGALALATPTHEGLRAGAAQVDRCQVVVSGDSLGMHMAIALGKHVVAWFGPTCPQEIDLFRRGVKLLAPVDCAPCWRRSCPQTPSCGERIEPHDICRAVLDCLAAREGGRPIDESRGGDWAPG